MGYDKVTGSTGLTPKGGIDSQFLSALKQYHADKYLNFNKEVPVISGKEKEPEIKPKDLVDRNEIKQSVRSMFEHVYGDQPNDTELDAWAGLFNSEIKKRIQRVEKRGVSKVNEGLVSSARAAVQEKFMEDPKTELLTNANEENTSLRDKMIRMAQIDWGGPSF